MSLKNMTDDTGQAFALTQSSPPVPPHDCCWHYSSFQHAAPNHKDEVCCHCGVMRCVTLVTGIPPGHGRYCPERVLVSAVAGNEPVQTKS